MATETSEPQVGRIASVGILAIVTLVVVRGALVSYFDSMSREEMYRKVGSLKPEALISLRADEKARLASGPMPIDDAIQKMVSKGRMGASADVTPNASRDIAPLQGWVQMPSTVPTSMGAGAPPADSAPSPASSAPPAASGSAAPAASAPSAPSGASARPAPGAPPAGSGHP